MKKIKKVGVLSLAKFQGVMFGLIGLVMGFVYSFGGLAIDILVSNGTITSAETPGLSFGTLLAFGALIGMPLLFGAYGFITGAVGAFFYNLVVKWTGGIEIELEG